MMSQTSYILVLDKKKQTAKQLGICLNLKYDNLDMKIYSIT